MARQRKDRHDEIRDIVRRKVVRTQEELMADLALRGFPCGQGTVSRDIADIGMSKAKDGTYILESDMDLCALASTFVTGSEYAGNLAVIRTRGGTASGVVEALDAASLPGVMCAVGDRDAVLVACRSEKSAQHVADVVTRLAM